MRRGFLLGRLGVVTTVLLLPALLGTGAPAAAATSTFALSGMGSSLDASPSTSIPTAASPSSVSVAPGFIPSAGTVDLGAVAPDLAMSVAVGLAPSNASGLEGLLAAEYTPGAPEYRGYLTPPELAQRFGPAPETVARAEQYFAAFGLGVSVTSNGLLLLVEGPSRSVSAAFGTSFQAYRDPAGRLFVSHPTPAELPAGLPWTGAFGLGNVTPLEPDGAPITEGVALAGPAAGTCLAGPSGLSPCEVQTAYQFASMIANGTNGSGERLGIVDAYSGNEPETALASDLASFASEFDLPVGTVHYLYPVPSSVDLNESGVNPAWSLEEALDLEWARAAAPGATIDMTFSPNSGAGLYYAIDALVATAAVNVVSLSWGEPDTGVYNAYQGPCAAACNASTDGSYALLSPVLEFAAAEGISVFAASGDCGASDGTSGRATNFPASDPYVTGVGGTDLTVGTGGVWESETGWSGNAPGSAAPGCENQGGSGGGFAPFPRPWWQTGLPVQPAGRGVPDVALDAADPVTVVEGGENQAVIGTSVATPIWAGLAAIADQRAGTSLGLLNPSLYRVAGSANYTHDFHEILTGNNSYSAGPGWNPVTGLGTPIASSLLPALAAVPTVTASAPALLLYASPRFGAAPLTVTFAVTATGGTGTYPLEGVSFGDGNASVANGTVKHAYPTAGVYAAQAWAFDSAGNMSVSPPVAIVVGGGTALNVSLSASEETPAVGANVTFITTVTGGEGPYRFSYFFGDGTSAVNRTSATAVHAFGAAGSFCASVVVSDSAVPPDGGASNRVALEVGGAPAPDCGNASSALSLVPVGPVGIRDAPADFPSLFRVSGGASGALGVTTTVQYSTNDSYIATCECLIFRAPGVYVLKAWANDSVNQQANATALLTVAPPLVGAFAVSRSAGYAPLTVEFFSAVKGGYLANANHTVWSFGDGTSAVGHTVNKTYLVPGEYWAVGQVSDAGNGNASEAFLIDVEAPGSSGGAGLVGSVSPAVDAPSATTVAFTAGTIGTWDGNALSVAWEFEGGHTAYGTGANQTFFAPFPGRAPETLTGTIAAILPNTVPVFTEPFSFPSFFAEEAGGFLPAASAISLTAAFAPSLGLTPIRANGTGVAAGPGGAAITWFFGDGASLSGNAVNHTYYAAQEYTVRAEGRDAFGDRAVDSFGLVANGPLQVFGGPSPASGVPPVTVAFSALGVGGTGPPYSYRWNLSGGFVVNGSTGTVTYTKLGFYSATVNVTDNTGGGIDRTWTIDIHPPIALTVAEILALGSGVGVLLAVAVDRGWFRKRPNRPSLSQRREAEAVRRVV